MLCWSSGQLINQRYLWCSYKKYRFCWEQLGTGSGVKAWNNRISVNKQAIPNGHSSNCVQLCLYAKFCEAKAWSACHDAWLSRWTGVCVHFESPTILDAMITAVTSTAGDGHRNRLRLTSGPGETAYPHLSLLRLLQRTVLIQSSDHVDPIFWSGDYTL